MIVLAEPKEYVSIKDNVSRTVDKLEIKSIHFVDNTEMPSNNFGLTAEIANTRPENLILKAKISYYDKDKVLIYSGISEYQLKSGRDNTFLAMLDSKLNSKYEISDIAFYTVDFETRVGTLKRDTVSAKNDEECQNASYTVEKYDVIIDVDEDNNYKVHENVTIHYNDEKRIIKRTIPFKRIVHHRNGSTSSYNVKVTDFESDQNYRTHFNISTGTYINIDNSDDSKEPEKKYSIDYDYVVNSKSLDDEMHFELASSDWNACVSNISFTINMPKNFDATTLQIVEEDGKDISQKIDINKSGNTVTGTYDDILKGDDNFSFSIFLGQDYFNKKRITLPVILVLIIPTCLIFLSFIIWFFFGRDRKIKEHQSDKLPKNKSILELALSNDGELKRRDIIFMLMKLADDGYIRFEKSEENPITKIAHYDIIKMKEYAGKDASEKKLLAELFDYRLADFNDQMLKKNYSKGKGSKKLSDMRGLTTNTKDLSGALSSVADSIMDKAIKDSYDKIFEKSATILSKIVSMFGYLIGLSLVVLPTIEYGSVEDIFIIAVLYFVCVISIREGIMHSKKATTRIASLIMVILSILVSRVTPLWETIVYERIYLNAILYGILVIILNSMIIYIMPKKTAYGMNIDEQLYSLREYLKALTKERLNERLKEEPTFLSKALPLSYILGIDREFLKTVENSKCSCPEWLGNVEIYDLKNFVKDLEILITKS